MFAIMGFFVFLKVGDPIRVIETTIGDINLTSTDTQPIDDIEPITVENTTFVNHFLRYRDPIDNTTTHSVGGLFGKFSFGVFWYGSMYTASLSALEFWTSSAGSKSLGNIERCNLLNHPYHDSSSFNERWTTDGVCPPIDSMILSGTDYSASNNFFEIIVGK
jgi:hypothetical protein